MAILKSYLQAPGRPITVAMIGAGGTGSMLLTHLARINKGLHAIDGRELMVTLYDPDHVSEANMGRQMFSMCDLGQYKAQVLIERVNRFYGLNWQYKNKAFNGEAANIIITCTDTKRSRKAVHNWYQKLTCGKEHMLGKRIYFWIDCGNGQTNGNVIVASPDYGWPTVVEHADWNDTEDKSTPSCSLADALMKQDLFVNSWVANTAGTWLWQILRKKQINWRGMFFDLDSMRMRKIPVDSSR
jgi:PRTRC genetic system ThiF family protein